MSAQAQSLSTDAVPAAVKGVIARLKEVGHQAFLVGGCVRDLLRGRPAKDFDVATSAHPEDVLKLFPRVIPTGVAHGTVTVVSGGHHVEVTTFRTESGYVDGRRPTKVEFHSDLEADLARRDFTINAMACDPSTDKVTDPFGGQGDLAAQQVRCVGSALERFSEDGLRALRAVRFATVLGFTIHPETFAAIGPTVPVFRKVAVERVREEFQKILLDPRATVGLELLAQSTLAAAFLPEVTGRTFAAVGRAPARLEVRLAVLLDEVALPGAVATRLRFPTRTIDAVAHLAKFRAMPAGTVSDAALRRHLAGLGLAALDDALDAAAALGSEDTATAARLRAIAASKPPLSAKELALDGREIMLALGVGPSPAVGVATRKLLDAVLEDPTANTKEALGKLLSAGKG